MIKEKLIRLVKTRQCTLLGVGPMSLNCVNGAIELANEYNSDLMMIASRRQIDSEKFDGGYVNNWTTKEFSEHVRGNDTNGKILLARDHGGPWQNTKEIDQKLTLSNAMESAKSSYLADIEAGFKIVHIDPSVDIHGSPTQDEILDRVFELYEYCWTQSKRLGVDLIFEIGTEEQSGSTNTKDELEYTLTKITEFCKSNNITTPTFVVIQTGTRVMETRNVGSFDTALHVKDELAAEIQVPMMIEICNKFGIMMKEHNTDYLSNEALEWHPRLGIHAANVAPEFGVVESKAFADILQKNKMDNLAEDFFQTSYDSKKWEKWMLDDTEASDNDKSIIAGHYVFSTPAFMEIKKKAERDLNSKGVKLDRYLTDAVKSSIFRYMKNFRLA
tara:strand:+ start:334 stop:1494 length:1161 start_codon:yes stop_codon:yes gene_type:complete